MPSYPLAGKQKSMQRSQLLQQKKSKVRLCHLSRECLLFFTSSHCTCVRALSPPAPSTNLPRSILCLFFAPVYHPPLSNLYPPFWGRMLAFSTTAWQNCQCGSPRSEKCIGLRCRQCCRKHVTASLENCAGHGFVGSNRTPGCDSVIYTDGVPATSSSTDQTTILTNP